VGEVEINFLDIRVLIPDSACYAFEQALHRFLESGIDFEREPKIVKGELRVHSLDLHSLLGFLDKSDTDEMSFKRSLSMIAKCLEGFEAKTLKKEMRAHYQWCLAALKNFEIGRHLGED
jgi:hypothetical protein